MTILIIKRTKQVVYYVEIHASGVSQHQRSSAVIEFVWVFAFRLTREPPSHGPMPNNHRCRRRLVSVARRDVRQSTQRQVFFYNFFFFIIIYSYIIYTRERLYVCVFFLSNKLFALIAGRRGLRTGFLLFILLRVYYILLI